MISRELDSYLGYREPVRFIADTNVKENHESVRAVIYLGLRYIYITLSTLHS